MKRISQILLAFTACFVPRLAAAETCPQDLACHEGGAVVTGPGLVACQKPNGNRHGWVVRCSGGTVVEKGLFVEDRPQGVHRTWTHEGVILSEQWFEDGEPHGMYRRWHRETGKPAQEVQMVRGKPFGLERRWHPDGSIASKMIHSALGPDGAHEEWYPSGARKLHAHYESGKLNGPYVRYHDNGQVLEKYAFREGKQHGSYEYRDDAGEVIRKGLWEDGKMVGEWVEVEETMNPKTRIGAYADSKKQGRWETRDASGQLLLVETYDRSILNGPYETYKNGKVRERGRYERGFMDGVWNTLDARGEVERKRTFDFGMQLETCTPSGSKMKCKSEVPWRQWGLGQCQAVGDKLGAIDVFDASAFDEHVKCSYGDGLSPIDWQHYRLWVYSYDDYERVLRIRDVERKGDAFDVKIQRQRVCVGTPMPNLRQVEMVLMPRSKKSITFTLEGPPGPACPTDLP